MSFMSLMANTAHQLWYPTSFPSMKELEKEEVRLETQELAIKQFGFRTIRPIGLNRSMQEQLDLEEQEREEANQDTELDEEELGSGSFPEEGEMDDMDGDNEEVEDHDIEEVDLDADITNADASEFYEDMSEYGFQN
ncbi:Anaphase-promoting complex subunit Apc15 [Schizosaccharomyces pombe]